MLMLRFEIEDGERDWKFQSMPPASGLQSLKRSRPMEPRVSPVFPSCLVECGVKTFSHASSSSSSGAFESGCSCGRKSSHHPENPAGDDDNVDAFPTRDRMLMSDAQEFPFGVGGDFGEDEGFDLGPPPPSGPVLTRQKAVDMTAAREAKASTLAQKVDPRASMNPSAALRSTSLISSSSTLNRRSRFMAV